MNVLIAVTHLLGTGHLARALTLARAFVAQGHKVQILSGGGPAPQLDHSGVDLLQLPPLRSDGVDFTRLLIAGWQCRGRVLPPLPARHGLRSVADHAARRLDNRALPFWAAQSAS